MKSFYKHLKSINEFGEKIDLIKSPVLRSSGIFPVIKNEHFSSRVIFLGYWLIKRNIPEVCMVLTLRNNSGVILYRDIEIIDTVKAYTIELAALLRKIDISSDFIGSLEIELNTTRDMVFPYPALVLEYYNKQFNTCVHTMGRVYNDFEDLNNNDECQVPETGFDIHSSNDLTAFFAFVNGPIQNKCGQIDFTITNFNSEKFSGKFELGKIEPYETKFVELKEHLPDLDEKLNGNSGSISLKHNFEGFYPRLLAGNLQRSFPSVSFTHSYYDCSECIENSDYWDRASENYYDSSMYVPLFVNENLYTELIIYPNFSPAEFSIEIILFDKKGEQVIRIPDYLNIKSGDSKLLKLSFNSLIEENNCEGENTVSAKIITHFNESRIPTRLKFGLNVGINNKQSILPCNICFNSHLGNPNLEKKPGSFHWAPLFCSNSSVITIANFSSKIDYSQKANIVLNIYRSHDASIITREFSLGENEEYRFNCDEEIMTFLHGETGWVTIVADNPNIKGFYFDFHASGSVSGDHIF